MDFNFLPTDNLYKFLSITGVFIVVFSVYYNNGRIDDLNESNIKYLTQLKMAKNSMVLVNSDLKKLISVRNDGDSIIKESIKLRESMLKEIEKTEKVTPEKINEFTERENSLQTKEQIRRHLKDSLERKIEEKNNLIDITNIQIEESELILNLKTQNVKYYFRLLLCGSIIGMLISLFGFKNWYKYQKKQDQLLIK